MIVQLLIGLQELAGNWFEDRARGRITLTSAVTHVMAHICTLVGNTWRCGCTNDDCSGSAWQLQSHPAAMTRQPFSSPAQCMKKRKMSHARKNMMLYNLLLLFQNNDENNKKISGGTTCFLLMAFCFVNFIPNTAVAQSARADQWPASWINPLTGSPGGSVEVTVNYGAWSLGCPNAAPSPSYAWYLGTTARDPRQQHLGIDLRIAATRPVYAIADGTIVASSNNLAGWNEFSQGVIIVRHNSLQESFTTAYAHLRRSVNPRTDSVWRPGDRIQSGEILGQIVIVGTGPHLHFGIKTGAHENIDAVSSTGGTGDCLNQQLGTVDPIPYLRMRAPNRCRNLIDRNNVPVNFGAPFNPFAGDRALLFEAVCGDDSNVEIQSGHNYDDQWTFRDGYYWDGGKWVKFRFSGANRDGIWFRGLAIASVPARLFPSVGSDKANIFVVWTCLRVSGDWRCGFRDTRRSDPSWQIQTFIYE